MRCWELFVTDSSIVYLSNASALSRKEMNNSRSTYPESTSVRQTASREPWLRAALWLTFFFSSLSFYSTGSDLAPFYLGCRLVSNGESSHLYDHDPEQFNLLPSAIWRAEALKTDYFGNLHPYVQAPLLVRVLEPVCTTLSFESFLLVFKTAIVVSLAVIVNLISKNYAPQFLRPFYLAILLLATYFSTPYQYLLRLAQPHIIIVAMTIASLIFAEARKKHAAGILLAIAAFIKISPGFVALYWLAKKNYQALISFLFFGLILVVSSSLVMGFESTVEYAKNLHRISNTLLIAFNNQSYAAWIMYGERSPNELFGWYSYPLPMFVKLISLSLLCLVIVLAAVSSSIYQNTRMAHAFGAATTLVAICVFTPLSWSHYYIVMIFPVMLLIQARVKGSIFAALVIVALNFEPLSLDQIRPVLDSYVLVRSQFLSGVFFIFASALAAIVSRINVR